jgi:hypothetical protein
MGDQPPAGSPPHALLERAAEATRAAAAGDLGPIAQAMGRARAQVEASVGPLFERLAAALGPLERVEPLGVQDGPRGLRLVVALHFERGRRYLMNAWEAGQLAGLLVSEEPPRRTVRPVDRATFVEHDLRGGRSFRVRFETPRGEHGPPAAAVFETWQGEARVPRATE